MSVCSTRYCDVNIELYGSILQPLGSFKFGQILYGNFDFFGNNTLYNINQFNVKLIYLNSSNTIEVMPEPVPPLTE